MVLLLQNIQNSIIFLYKNTGAKKNDLIYDWIEIRLSEFISQNKDHLTFFNNFSGSKIIHIYYSWNNIRSPNDRRVKRYKKKSKTKLYVNEKVLGRRGCWMGNDNISRWKTTND